MKEITNATQEIKCEMAMWCRTPEYKERQKKLMLEENFDEEVENNIISFEDYVEALPDDASAPKSKLQRIVDKQRAMAQQSDMQLAYEQQRMQENQDNIAAMQSLMQENAKLKAALAEVGNAGN